MEKTMLWLPGWGMTDQCWSAVRSQFPSYRHLVPDYSAVTSPEHFAHAIQKEIHALEAQSLIVVGWSMGGMLALRLAAEHPVAGLVLIGTTARFVRSRDERQKGWSELLVQRMKQLLPMERERVMTDFMGRMLTEKEREEGQYLLWEDAGRQGWSLQALDAGLSYLCEEDCRPWLASLSCPTLIIHGTEDVICPMPAGEELAARIPHAAFLQLAGCGHAPPVFCPDVIAEAIKRMVGPDVEDSRQQPF
ncbi:alpha/beta hydrolase [Brevibacillus sp. NRS-1366]|uniref:alpha/beta fold hydrolase n=1 Tax=Brevibacillus sp. NRS-1366 TaxID=3233899 RepID=UPI003D21DD6B